jgi:hypothetical protein
MNDVSCNSFCDGSINLLVNDGVLPYTYDWFGNDPDSLCVGMYAFQITDSLGCIYVDSGYVETPDSLDLTISLNGLQLTANVIGGTPPYNYNWFSATNQLGTNQSILISYSGYYYCLAYDQNHCQSDTVAYFYNDISPTVIYESNFYNFSIYPNPTLGLINISFEVIKYQNINIFLIDVLGKSLLVDKLTSFKGKYKKQIDISKFAKGMYLLKIELLDCTINNKVILE